MEVASFLSTDRYEGSSGFLLHASGNSCHTIIPIWSQSSKKESLFTIPPPQTLRSVKCIFLANSRSSLYLSGVIIPGNTSGLTQFVPLAKILILFISTVNGGSFRVLGKRSSLATAPLFSTSRIFLKPLFQDC